MAVDATRAKSLFLAAADIPNDVERAAYLGRECGDDAELQAQVEALLRANAPAPSLTGAYFPATDGSDRYAHPAKRCDWYVIAGRYNLVEVIGEGGMGSVYRAEQSAPVNRQVALKLIKSGMDSKAVLQRFEAERQALALMDLEVPSL